MITLTSEERKAWKEESKQITLTFDDGQVLTNEDIYYESFSLEQTLCDDSALTFGKCIPSELSIKIYNIPKSHIGSKLNIKITAGTQVMDFGDFIVVEDSLTDDKQYRNIKAYDKLYEINNKDVAEWYNSIWRFDKDGNVIPQKLKAIRDSFFLYIGVEQEEITLVNDNMDVEQTVMPQNLSGKDFLESLCEINAVFGKIGVDGKFRYVKIQDKGSALYPSNTLYPSNYLFPSDVVRERLGEYKLGTLKYKDYKCKAITKLQIRMEEGDIGCSHGYDGNTYVIEDNFLLFGKLENELITVATNFLSNINIIEYNPTSVETYGMPWVELGDTMKVSTDRDTVYFPILHRTLKGIQALSDSFEAQGVERYSERVNGIQNEVLKLKGKSNVIERTIEETKSTITNLDSKLVDNYYTITQTESAISQKANEITLRVDSIQRQVNGMVDTYYGSAVPSLTNYPAISWTTEEQKLAHEGDRYFQTSNGKILGGYRFLRVNGSWTWDIMDDSEVMEALEEAKKAYALAEEAMSQITMNKDEILLTVSKEQTKWDVDNVQFDYSGYGNPNDLPAFQKTSGSADVYGGKIYLDVKTGKLYLGEMEWQIGDTSTNLPVGQDPWTTTYAWDEIGQLETTIDKVESIIDQKADSILAKVAKSTKEWDESSHSISFYGYGFPKNISVAQDGNKYLDRESGWVYQYTNGQWVKIAELNSVTANLKSSIALNTESIVSEVSKIAQADRTWDTSGYNISLYGYGSPKNSDAKEENINKYYLDLTNGYLYICSFATVNFFWVYITTLQESLQTVNENLSSRIAQTATDISLQVSNNEKTSGIKISMKKADGSTKDVTGTIEMTGVVTFSDLSTQGNTIIHGGNIQTGTLKADNLSSISANLGTITAGKMTFSADNVTTIGKFDQVKDPFYVYEAWRGTQSLVLEEHDNDTNISEENKYAIAIKRHARRGNYKINSVTNEKILEFSEGDTHYYDHFPFYLRYDGYMYAEKCKIGGEIDIYNGRFKVDEGGNIHTKIGNTAYATKDDASVIVWCVGHTSGLASDLAIPRRIRFVNGLYVGTEAVSGMSSRNLGSLPT